MSTLHRCSAGPQRAPIGFPALRKCRERPRDGGQGLLGFETEMRLLPACPAHVPHSSPRATSPRVLTSSGVDRGQSLEAIVRAGPLAPSQVAQLGIAVANALHSLHKQDVIHLDLKPENVIIRALRRSRADRFRHGAQRAFPGSPGRTKALRRRLGALYLRPEQVLGDLSVPAATSSPSA